MTACSPECAECAGIEQDLTLDFVPPIRDGQRRAGCGWTQLPDQGRWCDCYGQSAHDRTVPRLVGESGAGFTDEELRSLLHIPVRPFLLSAQWHGYPLPLDATCEQGRVGLFPCLDTWCGWVMHWWALEGAAGGNCAHPSHCPTCTSTGAASR